MSDKTDGERLEEQLLDRLSLGGCFPVALDEEPGDWFTVVWVSPDCPGEIKMAPVKAEDAGRAVLAALEEVGLELSDIEDSTDVLVLEGDIVDVMWRE